jgi:hypothetical protein
MGDIVRLIPKSELERIRLIREARAIYDSIFPPTDVVGEQPDGRVSQGTQPAERACFLEKKRSDDRNDLVRKFRMEGRSALGKSLELNVRRSCRGAGGRWHSC